MERTISVVGAQHSIVENQNNVCMLIQVRVGSILRLQDFDDHILRELHKNRITNCVMGIQRKKNFKCSIAGANPWPCAASL